MKSFFCLYIFLLSLSASQTEAADSDTFIKSVIAIEPAVFASEYEREALSSWMSQYEIAKVEILSEKLNLGLLEIAVNLVQKTSGKQISIIVVSTQGAQQKVVEIRKRIAGLVSKPSDESLLMYTFIERLVWLYEIRNPELLKDFLFPNFVQLAYGGHKEQKKVLSELRNDYPASLPITSIIYNIIGDMTLIIVELDSQLKALQISVELQKYATVRFYERQDVNKRVDALCDSILLWSTQEAPRMNASFPLIRSLNPVAAMEALVSRISEDYDVSLLEEHKLSKRVRLIWPFAKPGYYSADYLIEANEVDNKLFSVQGHWLSRNIKMSQEVVGSENLMSKLNEIFCYFTCQGYLPPECTAGLSSPNCSYIVEISGLKKRSFTFDEFDRFDRIISNLSVSKPRHVRLVGIEPVDKSVHALFSIIWQHKKLDLLHIGELSCTWDYTDSQYKIKNVQLTLKPFIRSDYLSILSSSSDANKVK